MEAPGRLFLSPDGHGGTLTALASSGLLARLREKGIRHIFYFQVDNPLVKVADPTFLGCHIDKRSEASSRVIPKLGPTDKLGNFVQIDGRCSMIEYSDLPLEMAQADGRERPAAAVGGQPGHPLFRRGFPGARDGGRRPAAVPRRPQEGAVPRRAGRTVQPDKENALKFERFIFDVLPLAERWAVVETSRARGVRPAEERDRAPTRRRR